MAVLSILINTVLIGTSAYAMYKIPHQSAPYLFAATAITGFYGVRGLIANLGKEETATKVNGITDVIMEICPYTLRNLQFFEDSGRSGNIVLYHMFLHTPLLFFLVYNYFKDNKSDEAESNMYKLSELSFYGNSAALIQMGLNDDNNIYLMMAATAFMARYCPALCQKHYEDVCSFFLSILCFLDSETTK